MQIDNHFNALVARRYATHFGVIALILAAFLLGQIRLPALMASTVVGPGETAETDAVGLFDEPLPPPPSLSYLFLTKAALPRTTVPERPREQILIYAVQSGDTLYGIAQKFGISGETVMWANERENNPDLLSVGQELVILPVSGVYHTVQEGDTVESVAAKYQVEPDAVTAFPANGLEPPYDLRTGQRIIVPGGEKPYVARVVHAYQGPVPEDATRGTGIFGWPASGLITQRYWGGHRAIDIASARGTPVFAADSGYVAMAGWSNAGYGNVLIIDHGNGFQTLYAHLDSFNVLKGQSVKKGQTIGTMGATGRATGPHLHFEIHKAGVQRNPLGILP
jgi:murein DD-endopeptidase MepM/ murein hydrolase activator NlpD